MGAVLEREGYRVSDAVVQSNGGYGALPEKIAEIRARVDLWNLSERLRSAARASIDEFIARRAP